MIPIKDKEAIIRMREVCSMAAQVLETLKPLVRPGITTMDLEEASRAEIARLGARSACFGYQHGSRRYPAHTCISVNEEVVHGIPSYKRILRQGDIVVRQERHAQLVAHRGIRIEMANTSPATGPTAPSPDRRYCSPPLSKPDAPWVITVQAESSSDWLRSHDTVTALVHFYVKRSFAEPSGCYTTVSSKHRAPIWALPAEAGSARCDAQHMVPREKTAWPLTPRSRMNRKLELPPPPVRQTRSGSCATSSDQ